MHHAELFGEVACPTGTIAFTDNGSRADAILYTLNSFGYTEDQAIQLTGGTHTLVANYSGDNSYNTSSATATVTVTPAPTTIGNVAQPEHGKCRAAIHSHRHGHQPRAMGLAPTGTVKFFYNTTLLGTATTTGTAGNFNSGVTASLAASLTTSIPTAGTYNITATYTSGDANYASQSSSNSVSITVNASATFTLAAAPSSVTIAPGGAGGTSTITVTDVGGFTGNVSLAASGLPSGVTAGFSPNPTAATSILTLTASGSAATGGPTTVTITGTSGTLTATTTVAPHGQLRTSPFQRPLRTRPQQTPDSQPRPRC